MTFIVADVRHAVERARAAGLRVVDEDYRDPRWQEAFISPRSAFGTIVQLAQSNMSEAERKRHWSVASAGYSRALRKTSLGRSNLDPARRVEAARPRCRRWRAPAARAARADRFDQPRARPGRAGQAGRRRARASCCTATPSRSTSGTTPSTCSCRSTATTRTRRTTIIRCASARARPARPSSAAKRSSSPTTCTGSTLSRGA